MLSKIAKKGLALFEKRTAAADQLASSIEAELDDLRMAGARFQVAFERRPNPEGVPLPNGERVAFDSTGLEHVEFLIETNPGEGFKPMVKIASGGETARLMLALKNVLAQADHVPTLIFDEIDQGIGGRVGRSGSRQVGLRNPQRRPGHLLARVARALTARASELPILQLWSADIGWN